MILFLSLFFLFSVPAVAGHDFGGGCTVGEISCDEASTKDLTKISRDEVMSRIVSAYPHFHQFPQAIVWLSELVHKKEWYLETRPLSPECLVPLSYLLENQKRIIVGCQDNFRVRISEPFYDDQVKNPRKRQLLLDTIFLHEALMIYEMQLGTKGLAEFLNSTLISHREDGDWKSVREAFELAGVGRLFNHNERLIVVDASVEYCRATKAYLDPHIPSDKRHDRTELALRFLEIQNEMIERGSRIDPTTNVLPVFYNLMSEIDEVDQQLGDKINKTVTCDEKRSIYMELFESAWIKKYPLR